MCVWTHIDTNIVLLYMLLLCFDFSFRAKFGSRSIQLGHHWPKHYDVDHSRLCVLFLHRLDRVSLLPPEKVC